MTKIMDLVTYGKFKTLCDCNGGPYEYINHIDYTQAQQAYEVLQQERDTLRADAERLAEALYEIAIQKQHRIECPNLSNIAYEALAEFRKRWPNEEE